MRSHWVVHRLRTPEEVYVAHLDSVMVRSAAQSPTSRKSQVSKLRQIMASWGKVASIESGRSVARRTQAGSPLVFNGPLPVCAETATLRRQMLQPQANKLELFQL